MDDTNENKKDKQWRGQRKERQPKKMYVTQSISRYRDEPKHKSIRNEILIICLVLFGLILAMALQQIHFSEQHVDNSDNTHPFEKSLVDITE